MNGLVGFKPHSYDDLFPQIPVADPRAINPKSGGAEGMWGEGGGGWAIC